LDAGIDVTEAELIAQTSWRRQEKTEMVGAWKAKVYDMHHVHDILLNEPEWIFGFRYLPISLLAFLLPTGGV
jgi:hypothetical protein